MIQEFKDEMKKMFEMSDLGMMNDFLGMEVMQSSHGIFTCQKKYASDILKRFKMQDCKLVGTPMTTSIKLSKDDESEKVDESLYRGLIGSLQYLTTSRPDILFCCEYSFKVHAFFKGDSFHCSKKDTQIHQRYH
jgi:hypothetical protein